LRRIYIGGKKAGGSDSGYTCLGSLGITTINYIVPVYCHTAQGARVSTALTIASIE
jgi:hypothetical protein